MAALKLEIPEGHHCGECPYLLRSDLRGGGTNQCKIFDCVLGNKLTNIFKCPMCIEQSRPDYKSNFIIGVRK